MGRGGQCEACPREQGLLAFFSHPKEADSDYSVKRGPGWFPQKSTTITLSQHRVCSRETVFTPAASSPPEAWEPLPSSPPADLRESRTEASPLVSELP